MTDRMIIEEKRFQQLTVEQLYNILALRSRVFVVEQACLFNDIDGKDQGAIHFFMCDDAAEVIAYGRLYFDAGTAVWSIGRVVTAAVHRRQGHSTAIIGRMLAHIDAASVPAAAIHLQAQAYLVDFYGSFGFVAVSDVYLDDGIPHVDMSKPI